MAWVPLGVLGSMGWAWIPPTTTSPAGVITTEYGSVTMSPPGATRATSRPRQSESPWSPKADQQPS